MAAEMRRIGRLGGPLPYSRNVSADVWKCWGR